MESVACSICKETGHRLDRCPELSAPLRPGFFAPSGGGGHSHDDDDEKLKMIQRNPLETKCPTLAFLSLLKKPFV